MNPLQPLAEGFVNNLASFIPLGFAFGAGMVATVNPCGFALLPAYISLYLGGGPDSVSREGVFMRLLWAFLISVAVTAGFVLLFGAAGLVLSAGGRLLTRVMPWLSLVIGAGLMVLGLLMLSGRHVYSGLAARLASRVKAPASRGIGSFFLFGIAYAIASLSCTLPIFLVVVGGGLSAGGVALGLWQFVGYALGMGLVMTVLTVGTALFKGAVAAYLRRLLPWVERVSAVLIIAAGGYIIYYWLTIGRDLLLS